MSRTRTLGVIGVLVLGVSVGALVGLDGESSEEARLQGPIAELAAQVRDQGGGGFSSQVLPRTLFEWLPNVRYEPPGGASFSGSQLVVVGRVQSVEKDLGFVEDVADEIPDSDGIPVDFENPDALWRTVHLTVSVDEVLGGDQGGASTVRVGLGCWGCHDPNTLDAAVADLERSLRAMGTVVLFLDRPSAVYYYDTTLWEIPMAGAMITFVGEDGLLSLPLLEPELAEMFLADSPDLDTLRAAARQPTKVIELVIGESGLPERVDTEPLDADG